MPLKKVYSSVMKFTLPIFMAALFAFTAANARIMTYGLQSEYGIKDLSGEDSPLYINPNAWDVFTSGDVETMLGINATKSYSVFQVEYSSTMVMEGVKIGGNTMTAVLQDRRPLFGGEGYLDCAMITPLDTYYSKQLRVLGGWKYNLNKYLDLDLGGTINYAFDGIAGAGLPAKNGYLFGGDIYAGLTLRDIYIAPFVYVGYNSPCDALKLMAGFAPVVSLYDITHIEDLYIETCIYYGYTSANRYAGDHEIGGHYWRNEYSYVQAEANLVYVYKKHWKFLVGVGYSYNNDGYGSVGQGGFDMGPDSNVWTTIAVGYVF